MALRSSRRSLLDEQGEFTAKASSSQGEFAALGWTKPSSQARRPDTIEIERSEWIETTGTPPTGQRSRRCVAASLCRTRNSKKLLNSWPSHFLNFLAQVLWGHAIQLQFMAGGSELIGRGRTEQHFPSGFSETSVKLKTGFRFPF